MESAQDIAGKVIQKTDSTEIESLPTDILKPAYLDILIGVFIKLCDKDNCFPEYNIIISLKNALASVKQKSELRNAEYADERRVTQIILIINKLICDTLHILRHLRSLIVFRHTLVIL